MRKNNGNDSRTYVECLDSDSKARYMSKCAIIDGVDPYELGIQHWSKDDSLWPSVNYIDIVNYLIYSVSAYTMDELRAYKSLEAYNQFVSDWVRDVQTYTTKDLCVCRAQVLHSMRMSEKLLNPWVIVEKTGKVLSAHCDCIAGLGETWFYNIGP